MNIAYFLTPKSDVVWLAAEVSMRAALERIQTSGYAAVPVLAQDGFYVGTITEGDLLRKLIDSPALSVAATEDVPLAEVPLRSHFKAVAIDAHMEELLQRAFEQNFVPVVDSRGAFVGIVRRRHILEYFAGVSRAKG